MKILYLEIPLKVDVKITLPTHTGFLKNGAWGMVRGFDFISGSGADEVLVSFTGQGEEINDLLSPGSPMTFSGQGPLFDHFSCLFRLKIVEHFP